MTKKGEKHSEESKQRMRERHIGKKLSEATKQLIRETSIGRKLSEETKQRIRERMSGLRRSEATKQLLREYGNSAEAIKRKREFRHSEEAKQLRREFRHTTETKKKISDSHRTRIRSSPEILEEYRQRCYSNLLNPVPGDSGVSVRVRAIMRKQEVGSWGRGVPRPKSADYKEGIRQRNIRWKQLIDLKLAGVTDQRAYTDILNEEKGP